MKSLAAIPDKAWKSANLNDVARAHFGFDRAFGSEILLGDLWGMIGVSPTNDGASNLFGLVLKGDQVLFKEGPFPEPIRNPDNPAWQPEQFIKLEKALKKKVAKFVEENQPKAEPISLPPNLLEVVSPDFGSFEIPESVASQADIGRLSDNLLSRFSSAKEAFLALIKDPAQNSLIRIEMPSRIMVKKTKMPALQVFMDKVATPYAKTLEKIKALPIVKKGPKSEQKDPTSVHYFSKETGDKISSVLKSAVLDKLHDQIVDTYFNDIKNRLDDFLNILKDEKAVLEKRLKKEEYAFQSDRKRDGYAPAPFPEYKKEKILKSTFLENFRAILPYDLYRYFKEPRLSTNTVPNVDAEIKKTAEKIAEEMEQTYLSKQVGKIAPIVEKRKDYKEAKVLNAVFYRGTIEADVRLTFENGDEFTAHTIIVDVTNQFGTRFYRYPTTFHDVKVGGKTLKRTDEDWMNRYFTNGGKQPPW